MASDIPLAESTINAGYPVDHLKTLVEHSQTQYDHQVAEHGKGKNWLRDEARWHIWKATDELFQARDHVHSGNYFTSLANFADALNHMLFAMEIAWHAQTEATNTASI